MLLLVSQVLEERLKVLVPDLYYRTGEPSVFEACLGCLTRLLKDSAELTNY
jgi:hypothetical protein